MRYFELTEGRDAPLYHATSIENGLQILKTGTLKAHELPDDDMWDGRDHKVLSFSRSLSFATDFGRSRFKNKTIIFELDQRKLSQTHKLLPWNYYSNAELSNSARVSRNGHGVFNEFEEFTNKDVQNINRYLTAIHVINDEVPVELQNNSLVVFHQTESKPKPDNSNIAKEFAKISNIPVDEIFKIKKSKDGSYTALMSDIDDEGYYLVGVWKNKKFTTLNDFPSFDAALKKFNISTVNEAFDTKIKTTRKLDDTTAVYKFRIDDRKYSVRLMHIRDNLIDISFFFHGDSKIKIPSYDYDSLTDSTGLSTDMFKVFSAVIRSTLDYFKRFPLEQNQRIAIESNDSSKDKLYRKFAEKLASTLNAKIIKNEGNYLEIGFN